ncbi:MAG: acylphosphatase [Cyanobacteria bacterium SZAS LIN-5]|nr:acylphosphatase [Cyanobacteria bacterium SZAS LIN-5]
MAKAILLIKGRVQGVGYRWSTREKADALGLRGWVRNLKDGSVEACALGDRAVVEALIDWCKEGPAHADVSSVEVSWADSPEAESGGSELSAARFEIR